MLKKGWLTLLLGALLLVQAPALCQAKEQPLFADQAAADSLLEQDYAAAQAVTDEFIAKYPEKAEGYFWKGYFYKRHDEDALAIMNLEKARALNPKDWSTLESLLALYVAADDKAKIYQTARECVKYYKKHKKKINTPPAEIARMYYWAGEYEEGLKLFAEIQEDPELNEVRAAMCRKLAQSNRNNGSIYLAKIYTVRGLDYAPGDAELLALDKELTELIAKDKAQEKAAYSGRDYYYRYYYWYHPYWFYGHYGHRHHHGRPKVFVPPPPRPHIGDHNRPRPGAMLPGGALHQGGRPPRPAVRPDKPNIVPPRPAGGVQRPARPGVQVPHHPRPNTVGPKPPRPAGSMQRPPRPGVPHRQPAVRPPSAPRPQMQRQQPPVMQQRPAGAGARMGGGRAPMRRR